MVALTLNVPSTIELTLKQFEQLAIVNPDLRLELTAIGGLVIMPPTGGETGQRNSDISGQLWYWNRQHNLGKDFDSSTGFRLPNGAVRAPDASWLEQTRWDALTPTQRQKFLPLCPDFAIELLSPSDDLEQTQTKMQEYLDNGLRLGWLINPRNCTVEIYRPGQETEQVVSPKTLSGETVLPEFTLDLSRVW
ncbi:MAG: Uma2 family endonuclease [Cyanobacteria bacterium P01_G01_bin.54]